PRLDTAVPVLAKRFRRNGDHLTCAPHRGAAPTPPPCPEARSAPMSRSKSVRDCPSAIRVAACPAGAGPGPSPREPTQSPSSKGGPAHVRQGRNERIRQADAVRGSEEVDGDPAGCHATLHSRWGYCDDRGYRVAAR